MTVNQNEENTYYSNLFSFYVKDRETMRFVESERYMTMPNIEYKEHYLAKGTHGDSTYLGSNQAIISKNLAIYYRLQIGDSLIVTKSMREFTYEIVYIVPSFYGDFEFDLSSKGIIIFGYNDELLDQNGEQQIISYSTQSLFNATSETSKSEIIMNNYDYVIINFVFLVLIYFAVYIFLETLVAQKANYDIQTFHMNGVWWYQTLMYTIINTFFKYMYIVGLPLLISLILGIIVSRMWFFMTLIFAFVLCLFSFVDVIRNKKYISRKQY